MLPISAWGNDLQRFQEQSRSRIIACAILTNLLTKRLYHGNVVLRYPGPGLAKFPSAHSNTPSTDRPLPMMWLTQSDKSTNCKKPWTSTLKEAGNKT